MKHCQGRCDCHHGEVHRVHVWHWPKDWGVFWYCENAIAVDQRNGFVVNVVSDDNMCLDKDL